jgi:hypothetical protein
LVERGLLLKTGEVVFGDNLPKTAHFFHNIQGRNVWMGCYH